MMTVCICLVRWALLPNRCRCHHRYAADARSHFVRFYVMRFGSTFYAVISPDLCDTQVCYTVFLLQHNCHGKTAAGARRIPNAASAAHAHRATRLLPPACVYADAARCGRGAYVLYPLILLRRVLLLRCSARLRSARHHFLHAARFTYLAFYPFAAHASFTYRCRLHVHAAHPCSGIRYFYLPAAGRLRGTCARLRHGGWLYYACGPAYLRTACSGMVCLFCGFCRGLYLPAMPATHYVHFRTMLAFVLHAPCLPPVCIPRPCTHFYAPFSGSYAHATAADVYHYLLLHAAIATPLPLQLPRTPTLLPGCLPAHRAYLAAHHFLYTHTHTFTCVTFYVYAVCSYAFSLAVSSDGWTNVHG